MKPICINCKKHPDELEEYIESAKENETTPDEFVRTEEGTYNPDNGHFVCTDCYIKIGMPSSSFGWVAP